MCYLRASVLFISFRFFTFFFFSFLFLLFRFFSHYFVFVFLLFVFFLFLFVTFLLVFFSFFSFPFLFVSFRFFSVSQFTGTRKFGTTLEYTIWNSNRKIEYKNECVFLGSYGLPLKHSKTASHAVHHRVVWLLTLICIMPYLTCYNGHNDKPVLCQ